MAEQNIKADEYDEYKKFSLYRKTRAESLRDELVNTYLYIAEILSKKFVNRGIDYEDIYQVACMGILYAVERFDPDKGVQFASFATPTVLGEIRKYFRDKGSFIKVPRKLYEIFRKAEKIKRSMNGAKTSDGEIAQLLGLDEAEVREAYKTGSAPITLSMDQEEYGDGDITLANVLGREDDGFVMIENKDFFDSCINGLDAREREFVTLRYYDELSQKQIAERWGRSQMYVSRMEKKVLKYMRDAYFR